ncbi:MAG: hypothetical protein LC650_05050 [Actinobacteria bacterium]|nr:hypothetical protein [Actinomycetota bacterium]
MNVKVFSRHWAVAWYGLKKWCYAFGKTMGGVLWIMFAIVLLANAGAVIPKAAGYTYITIATIGYYAYYIRKWDNLHQFGRGGEEW